MIRTCVSMVALALTCAGGALAQDAVQWRVEDGGNGHWYAFDSSVAGLWPACREEAEARGASLAQLETVAEHNFIVAIAKTSSVYGDYWLGGFQHSGSREPAAGWVWISGEALTFDAWGTVSPGAGAPPSPNDWPTNAAGEEDFLEICFRVPETTPFGGWDDQGDFGNPSLLEWSADCNGDGVVDYGQILQGRLEDANGNGVPDVCELVPCLGDVSGNGVVDGVDLAAVLGAWGSDGKGEFYTDIDGDGVVSGADLTIILSDWGPCPK